MCSVSIECRFDGNVCASVPDDECEVAARARTGARRPGRAANVTGLTRNPQKGAASSTPESSPGGQHGTTFAFQVCGPGAGGVVSARRVACSSVPLIVQPQSERDVSAGTSARKNSWPLCLHARGPHAGHTQTRAHASRCVTVGPRGASGDVCFQRRTQPVKRTGLSMTAAAHRVAVAAGALARPFRPSWRCQAGAAADHPEPRRSEVARFFLAVQHRP